MKLGEGEKTMRETPRANAMIRRVKKAIGGEK